MDRRPPPGERHRRRILERQARPLGDLPQQMQAHMRGHLPVAGGHPDPLHHPGTVHPGSALLVLVAVPSTSSSFPYQEGLFADPATLSDSRP